MLELGHSLGDISMGEGDQQLNTNSEINYVSVDL